MLTDRQQRFYRTIISLSDPNSSATAEERKYFAKAKKQLDAERNFRDTINQLLLVLEVLNTKESLSSQSKELFDELSDAYGKGSATTPGGNYTSYGVIGSPFGWIQFVGWLLITVLFVSLLMFNWLVSKIGVIGIIIFYVIGLSVAVFCLTRKWQESKKSNKKDMGGGMP